MASFLQWLRNLFSTGVQEVEKEVATGTKDIEREVAYLEMELRHWETRLKVAANQFAEKAGAEVYEATMQRLAELHQEAERLLTGRDEGDLSNLPWEFVHGYAVLHASDPNVKALPCHPKDFDTIVMKDGALFGCHKWEKLDPGWIESLEKWFIHLLDRADFVENPAVLPIGNQVTLGIAGDWGTGPFEAHAPSIKVGRQLATLNADYTIHLGDTYYAGIKIEENHAMKTWPQGSQGAFTLNSNHEMYSGAIGYYKLLEEFPKQQGTSYFALYNDHWLIVGLDTAYASESRHLYMQGNLNDAQIEWLGRLPKDRKVIVLSHHQPYDITGTQQQPVYQQAANALGQDPAYWYWGHLHNGIWYHPLNDGKLQGRCVGHGAIPYGKARELDDYPEQIAWYETQLAGDPHYPDRVLNGFMSVELDGPHLREKMIGEDGSVRWSNSGS